MNSVINVSSMSYLSIILAILLSPLAAFPADIASVNFDAIKDSLRQYYLAKPQNAEIKERLEKASREEKRMMEEVQAGISKGKGSLDIAKIFPKGSPTERFEVEREVDMKVKEELYLIIKELGLKYELIYDASKAGTIIYAKSQIDDLTTTVKQAIIERGAK